MKPGTPNEPDAPALPAPDVEEEVGCFLLEHFLPQRLDRTNEAVARTLDRLVDGNSGLKRAEWRLVAVLARGVPMTVRQIALRTGLDRPTVTRASQRLEALGLVARRVDTQDRRLVALTLTGRGRARAEALLNRLTGWEAVLLGRLSGEERVMLHRLLGKLQAGVEDLLGRPGAAAPAEIETERTSP